MSDCNIRVICRFRPINAIEKNAKSNGRKIEFQFPTKESVHVNVDGKEYNYTFDRVFVSAPQPDVYNLAAKDMVEDIIEGFNSTIFAYGQTGSGKSFSMFGADIEKEELRGIIPRACSHVFDYIRNDKNGTEFQIKCSFLEIYMEKIRDLLNPAQKRDLRVRESKQKGVYVDGLVEKFVSSEQDIIKLIKFGEKFRAVTSTNMNAVSSRSHSLFIMTLIQKFKDGSVKTGKLNLADLAGSEKVSKTGARGDTLREAKKINQSLSALGNCINALSSGKGHVPFRDSKLTFVLRDSLGGNCKTTVLTTATPHPYNIDETISTLQFAKRAKTIKNKVVVNKKRSVAELELIVKKLKAKLKLVNNYAVSLEGELKKTSGPNWKPPKNSPISPAPKKKNTDSPSLPSKPKEGSLDLQIKLEELREQTQETITELKEQIKELEEQKKEQEELVASFKSSIEKEKEKNDQLGEKLESLAEENDNLVEQNEALKKTTTEQEGEIGKMKEKVGYLQETLEETKKSLDEKKKIEAKLKLELVEKQSAIDKLESAKKFKEFDVQELNEEIEELETSIAKLQKINKELIAESDKDKDQILILQEQLNSQRIEMSNREEESDIIKTNLSLAKQNLELEKRKSGKLTKRLSGLKTTSEDSKIKPEGRAGMGNLQEMLDEEQKKEQQKQQQSDNGGNEGSLEKKLKTTSMRLEDFQKALMTEKTSRSKLEVISQKQSQQLVNFKEKTESLSNQIKELEEQNQTLKENNKKKIEQLQQQLKQRATAFEEFIETSKQKEIEHSKQMQKIQEELSAKDDKINELNEKVLTMNDELKQSKQTIKQQKMTANRFKHRISDLQEKLQDTKDKFAEKKLAVQELQRELKAEKERFETLQELQSEAKDIGSNISLPIIANNANSITSILLEKEVVSPSPRRVSLGLKQDTVDNSETELLPVVKDLKSKVIKIMKEVEGTTVAKLEKKKEEVKKKEEKVQLVENEMERKLYDYRQVQRKLRKLERDHKRLKSQKEREDMLAKRKISQLANRTTNLLDQLDKKTLELDREKKELTKQLAAVEKQLSTEKQNALEKIQKQQSHFKDMVKIAEENALLEKVEVEKKLAKQKKETEKIQKQLDSQIEMWTSKLKQKNSTIAKLKSQIEEYKSKLETE